MNEIHATVMPLFTDGEMDLTFDPEKIDLSSAPVLASRQIILFPGIPMPLSVGRAKSLYAVKQAYQTHQYLVVVAQRNDVENPTADDLFTVGTICEVMKILDMPDGTQQVFLLARRICRLERLTDHNLMLMGEVSLITEHYLRSTSRRLSAIISNLRSDIEEISQCIDNNIPTEITFAFANFKDNNYIGTFLCAAFPLLLEQRQQLLEQSSSFDRFMMLSAFVSQALQFARLKNTLHQQTQVQINEMQRQHYLHQEMAAIQQELGETTQDDVDKLLEKARGKMMPDEVLDKFRKDLNRMQRMQEQSPDYGVLYTYLSTLTDLPWGFVTPDNLNLNNAHRVLDRDHYGLEKVKERILEHLAVLKMRGDMKSPILCLFGPPGVGKTSLGRSIATALKRKYVRVSLGGLHDEAEIRGHRRTYIGAMPGRIISGLIKAKSDNPVFVLDEIDKISSDFKGDPSSALLEVLDPEQNGSFHDNFLDVDYDLSNVLFIATANNLSTISGPLRDRMEIIDLSGYIIEEKIEIGMKHLLPKQKREHGIEFFPMSVTRKAMEAIITRYTKESGVRLLDKRLAQLMRKAAWKIANDEEIPAKIKPEHLIDFLGKPDFDPDQYEGNDYAGVVTGLAWTSVGGCTLMVESILTKGKGSKLTLTGQLGDVMKESAQIALQWIRANADVLNIPDSVFENYNVHIHCPEGAIPKDGPSAGITMVTSLASAFTQRRVRDRIAMTGEITLRGRVLPIGGVKEKILAAKRAGIKDLVLCVDNRKDVEDIKPEYLEGLNFHYCRDLWEVLDFALLEEKVKHPKKFE